MHLTIIIFSAGVLVLLTLASPEINSTGGGATDAPTAATMIAKPGCQSRCGDLIVPYPFGIGSNCSMNPSFEITCNTSFDPPKPFIQSLVFSIIDEVEGTDYLVKGYHPEVRGIERTKMMISSSATRRCYDRNGSTTEFNFVSFYFGNTPFTISEENKLIGLGCNDYAILSADNNVHSGCLVFCDEDSSSENVTEGHCSGSGCCQTPVPKDSRTLNIRLDSFAAFEPNNTFHQSDHCSYAFLSTQNNFTFPSRGRGPIYSKNSTFLDEIEATVPVQVEWAIGNSSCAQAQSTSDFACQPNTTCVDSDSEIGGYHCECNDGYDGNPYLGGCQDINECDEPTKCYGHCINTLGGYECFCWPGYTGDAKTPNGCNKKSRFHVTKFSIGIVFGLLAVIIGITGLYFIIKKIKLIKLRDKFFKQNGGVFLKQQIAAKGIGAGLLTIFTIEKLKQATNNYSRDMILGRGGFSTVYKGILPDKRVVAIKKSKMVDENQKEQFINELLILIEINHRNVVKLLGCCLEDEVPLLVYEFVPNNTLFHHIHSTPGGVPWLSWENRLRIAAEAAGALAYLHSAASMPIIHRDVKTSNILLDESYNTKISDFGASRLVPLDRIHVTTLVQGTLGYLDPEYFHTSQLTDKSDVYSFGVVLAELLTGKLPLSWVESQDQGSLATSFVTAIKENRLFQILEPRVLKEGTLDQMKQVAELTKRCLNAKGKDRPTMKEVAMALEGLRTLKKYDHENTSSNIEKEESDRYDFPLVPYTNTFGSCSSRRIHPNHFASE